jgi:hypothetical protein
MKNEIEENSVSSYRSPSTALWINSTPVMVSLSNHASAAEQDLERSKKAFSQRNSVPPN